MKELLKSGPYILFEDVLFLDSECVSLGNDWNDVDAVLQHPHELQIQRLETMTHRWDEVQAGMDPGVLALLTKSVHSGLISQVAIKLFLNIVSK